MPEIITPAFEVVMIVAYVRIMKDERILDHGIKDVQPGNPLYGKFMQVKKNGEMRIRPQSFDLFYENFIQLDEVDLPCTIEKHLVIWSD
jgi:hypothetical protein